MPMCRVCISIESVHRVRFMCVDPRVPAACNTQRQVTHPTLGTWRHTPHPICSAPEYAPKTKHHGHRAPANAKANAIPNANANATKSVRSAGDPSCNEMPCTCDTLPCNNWIDTAGTRTTATQTTAPPQLLQPPPLIGREHL